MKGTTTVLLALMLAPAAIAQPAPAKKYGVKSGIIIFETTTRMGTLEMKGKYVVYFDDWGRRERKDQYDGDRIRETVFNDSQCLYRICPYAPRTALRSCLAPAGTEPSFDWGEVPEADKQGGLARRCPSMTVAGRNCESYELGANGHTSRYACWNGILLYRELRSPSVKTVTQAVKLDVGIEIPEEKFQVPDGFRVR